jgi:uncharacterized protein (DUF1778 family)
MPKPPPTRAMEIVSVRFGTDSINLLRQEAGFENVSVSQFIRDAAQARAVLSAARRNAITVRMWDRLIAVIEEAGNDRLSGELRDLLPEIQRDFEANGNHDVA